MSLNSKVGSFTVPSSTGNRAITGIGFQPTAIIFWGVPLTAAGIAAEACFFIGFTDGTPSSNVLTIFSANNNSGSSSGRTIDTTGLNLCIWANNGSTLYRAKIVSLDADGFTLNFTTANAIAYQINYLALTGTTGAKAGSFSLPTSGVTKAVTGVGFKPNLVLMFSSGLGISFSSALLSLGFMASSSVQGAVSLKDQSSQSPTVSKSYLTFQKCLVNLSTTLNAVRDVLSFNAFGTDGFTVNLDTISNSGATVYYLALKGVTTEALSFTQPSFSEAQTLTGLGGTPNCALMFSHGSSILDTLVNNARMSFGCGNASAYLVTWLGIRNGVTTSNTSKSQKIDININLIEFGATPLVTALGTLATLISTGAALVWTSVIDPLLNYIRHYGVDLDSSTEISSDVTQPTILGIFLR